VLNKLLQIAIAIQGAGRSREGKKGEGVRAPGPEGGRNSGFFTGEVKMCFLKDPTASVENTANN
jgi:hypothetical protein